MKATRRAVVAASGAATLGLAGCTSDGSSSTPPPTGSAESSATEPAAADPDQVALDRAVAITTGLLVALEGAPPGLDPAGRLAAMHTAHLDALQDATGASATPTAPVPAGTAAHPRQAAPARAARPARARAPGRGRRERGARPSVRQHVRRHRRGHRGPGPSGRMTVEALQTALAAEHAALYVYGVLGARTSESGTPALFAEVTGAYATHRAQRDVLTRRLLRRGGGADTGVADVRAADDADGRRRRAGGGGPRGRVRGDLRVRRREHRRRRPALGRRGPDRRRGPAGGVRSRPRAVPRSARPDLTAQEREATRGLPVPRNSRDIPRHRKPAGR